MTQTQQYTILNIYCWVNYPLVDLQGHSKYYNIEYYFK